jgi:hypothetical protein
MQDAGNQNPFGLLPVEHDMPTTLHAAQAWADVIAASAERRIISQQPATRLEVVEVTDGLVDSPRAECVTGDAEQVGFSSPRETKRSHRLTRRRGKFERFPNAFENVALGKAAGVTLINGRPQRCKLRLVLLFLPL